MADERSITAAFTGHRSLPKDIAKLKASAEKAIHELIARGVRIFICGGAVGFDSFIAMLLLNLRDSQFPHIKLIQVLPFKGMDEGWDAEQKKRFRSINDRADKVIWLADRFTGAQQYLDRNRHMVDSASYLVAFCKNTNARSGTAACYRYAVKKRLEVIVLEY